MEIASMTYTRRITTAKYEHAELTVESRPHDGQSAEELLAETKQFVERNLPPGNVGAPVAACPGPPAAPPQAPAETPPQTEKPKKSKRGRPSAAVKNCQKHVKEATEAEDMKAFFESLEAARELSDALDVDDWEQANKDMAARYRQINTVDSDPEICNDVVASFRAIKTAIEQRRANQ